MSSNRDDQTVRLRPGTVASREVDGETVVLDVRAGSYLGTNRSGTVLWRAMTTGATRGQLAEALVDAYGIDLTRAERAVGSFVAACRSRGLLDE